jgi:hypothetical protein
MKRLRLSLIAVIAAFICLVSSVGYYHAGQASSENSRKKYDAIVRVRSEGRAYHEKLESLNRNWAGLSELSQDQGPSVSYDVSVRLSSREELDDTIATTYEHGLFFLKSAVLEYTPGGISLAISGFKKGKQQP